MGVTGTTEASRATQDPKGEPQQRLEQKIGKEEDVPAQPKAAFVRGQAFKGLRGCRGVRFRGSRV